MFCIQKYHLTAKKIEYKSVKKEAICDKLLNNEVNLTRLKLHSPKITANVHGLLLGCNFIIVGSEPKPN